MMPSFDEPDTPKSDASLIPMLHVVDVQLSPPSDTDNTGQYKDAYPTNQTTQQPIAQMPTDKTTGNGVSKIRFLDGLRGLAAMMVVVAHTGRLKLNMGPPAVDIFFVLSAFLLTMGFEKKVRTLFQQQASYRRWGWVLLDYTQRRFLRVYPLFVIVATYLSFQSPEEQKKLYNVQNKYNLWKVLTFEKPWRYFVFWTLPLEITYYFFIPVFAIVVVKLGKYWWVPLGPTVIFIAHAGFTWVRYWDQPLGPHFPTFLTGSVSAVVYTRTEAWIAERKFIFRWYHTVALRMVEYSFLAIMFSVVFEGLLFHWIAENPVPQTLGVPFVHGNIAIVLVCEMLRPGAVASVLEWSLLRHAGKISFSMYLLHGIVGHATRVTHQKSQYDRFFAIWGLVFLVSTISFHVFEEPCLRLASWIGRWIRKRENDEIARERMRLPTSTPLPEAVAVAVDVSRDFDEVQTGTKTAPAPPA